MRYGENALKVIDNAKKKLEQLKKGLPEGVTIKTAYDRSSLIKRAINTLKGKLIEESAVVALVCMIFLLHFGSAFVAIFTLPMGILIAFIVMHNQGLNANIMSLGGIAIAIGAMVDAAIVMIENAHKHIERDVGKKDHWQIIIDASKEVGPALFFSLLIITFSIHAGSSRSRLRREDYSSRWPLPRPMPWPPQPYCRSLLCLSSWVI